MTRFRTTTLLSALAITLGAPNFATPQDAPEEVGLFDDEPAAEGRENIEVGAAGEISIDASDVDITTVLRGLSMQAGKNIMISRDVSGTVTFTIRDADFYEALDAILTANGFRYFEQGQFIHVVTAAEYQERVEQSRELTRQVIRLDYLNAVDAQAFVTPMLSENGEIIATAAAESGFIPDTSDGGENSYAGDDLLVVVDYQENIDQINETLEELDRRPAMVLIEATILQATLSENNALGTDFSLFFDIDGVASADPLGIVDTLIGGGATNRSGAVSTTDIGATSSPGGFKAGLVAGDAAVFVRALNSITNTTVVSSPKLTVLNRQKGDILVGEQLGYISTTQTEDSVTQTVEFLDVGTQLSVRPFVSEDGAIRLELRPSVSDGATRELAGFVVPDTSVAEMTTNIIVRSGQTVVLGGLFTEDIQVDRRQVPGLGDIPFVGNAFRGQDDDTRRSEVIFLVKATILENDALAAMGDRAADGVQLAQIGAGKGLLPWSRKKLAGAHLRDAADALRNAEEAADAKARRSFESQARWSANLALHLEPTSVRGLAIKREVDGGAVYLAEESILNSAIDTVIADEMDALTPGDAIDTQPQDAVVEEANSAEPAIAEPLAQAEPVQAVEPVAEEFVVDTPTDPADGFAEIPAQTSVFDNEADPQAFAPETADFAAESDPVEVVEQPLNDPFVGDGFETAAADPAEFGSRFDAQPAGSEDVALLELEQAERELESLIAERRESDAQAFSDQAFSEQADAGQPAQDEGFAVVTGSAFTGDDTTPFDFEAGPQTPDVDAESFEPTDASDFASFGAVPQGEFETVDADASAANATDPSAEGFWLFDFDSLQPLGQYPWTAIGVDPETASTDGFESTTSDNDYLSDLEAQAEADAIAGVDAK
ncbi:MAG: hypothetical protein AAF288_07670 [Planctomycetota bacterium]